MLSCILQILITALSKKIVWPVFSKTSAKPNTIPLVSRLPAFISVFHFSFHRYFRHNVALFNGIDNVLTFDDPAENGVFTVQPGAWYMRNEKL